MSKVKTQLLETPNQNWIKKQLLFNTIQFPNIKKNKNRIKYQIWCFVPYFCHNNLLKLFIEQQGTHFLEDILAQLTLQNLMKTNKFSLVAKKWRISWKIDM